jgi:hypothetical protein
MGQQMIDLPAAALRLHLSRERTLRLAFTGEIRAERRGGRWWFDAADVERVARELRVEDIGTW